MKKFLSTLPFFLICAICGGLTAFELIGMNATDLPFGLYALTLLGMILILYLAFFLQIILHEAGHLLFGLLTGYRFSSFRIGSLMWIKQDGRIRFKRFTLAGTGGQCLLLPPPLTKGKMPYMLYNLGGCFANLLTVVIGAPLLLLCDYGILHYFSILTAVLGLYFALMNGIPMNIGGVANDGFNARSLGKDSGALHAFWIQMKINEGQASGIRLKDMPDEWFEPLPEEDRKNVMGATLEVIRTSRLMDQHKFTQAAQSIDKLREESNASTIKVLDIHMNMMACDRIFCELIGEGDREKIETLLTKELRMLLKQMKQMISVIRTEYALALLYDNLPVKAKELETLFEKQAGKYPHPAEVEAEREFIQLAKETGMAIDAANER